MSVLALVTVLAIPLAAQEPERPRSIFVAVGYGGRRASSADGVHWENDQELVPNGGDDSTLICDIAFGKGKFVAVGGGAEVAPYWVTRDGKSWRELRPGWKGRVGHIAFGNDRFVAGASRFTVSPDGEEWKEGAKFPFDGWLLVRHIAFGNGIFVAAGDGQERGSKMWFRAVTSQGETIDSFEKGLREVRALAFGAGRFVAVLSDGSLESSKDGKTWERSEIDRDPGNYSVLWTGEKFVVGGGKVALLSSDGVSFEKAASRLPCHPMARGGGVFVGASWKRGLWTSVDALTWKQSSLSDSGNAFCAVAWGIPEPERK